MFHKFRACAEQRSTGPNIIPFFNRYFGLIPVLPLRYAIIDTRLHDSPMVLYFLKILSQTHL